MTAIDTLPLPTAAPESLEGVEPSLLRSQGIFILETTFPKDILEAAAARLDNPSAETVGRSLLTVVTYVPELKVPFTQMYEELADLGYPPSGVEVNSVALYSEPSRRAILAQDTNVDRLHGDIDFDAAIAASAHPSWYYLHPEGRPYSSQDYVRKLFTPVEGLINPHNIKAGVIGRTIFHTRYVPHQRPPKLLMRWIERH